MEQKQYLEEKRVWKTTYTIIFVQRPTESGGVVDWCRPAQQRLVDQ